MAGSPKSKYDEAGEMKDAPDLPYDKFIETLDTKVLRDKLLRETFGVKTANALATLNKKEAMNILQKVINEVDQRLAVLEVVHNEENYKGKQFLSVFDINMLKFEIKALEQDRDKLKKIITEGTKKLSSLETSWTEILDGYTTKLNEYAVKIQAEQNNKWEGELVRLKLEYEKLEKKI